MSSALPSALERRGLLYGKESRKADHSSIAETYLGAGRTMDALEFFVLAGDTGGIDRIRDLAVKEGDVFLLAQIERLTQIEEDPETWRRIGESSEENGKTAYALMAYEKAGDTEALARLDKDLVIDPENIPENGPENTPEETELT